MLQKKIIKADETNLALLCALHIDSPNTEETFFQVQLCFHWNRCAYGLSSYSRKDVGGDLDLTKVSDQGKANGGRHSPAPPPMPELDLKLKRTSVWLKMNSTTADCICTSMKALLLLMQADSLCCDLQKKQMK